MKIRLSRKFRQLGTALLVVMILGGILCLFVMYYLSLIQQQNTLSVRSQGWNLAIAITEAGIEDGLQALNSSATDGWTKSGSTYWRVSTLPDGNYYYVTNDLSVAGTPVITSRAYVVLPALAAAPGFSMFATAGSPGSGSVIISRAVRVTCGKNPVTLFTAAMVSKHVVDLNGNGVLTDSFDSSNPSKSTNGKYDADVYAGDFGDVATNDGVIVGVQNANIYGKLHTGAGGAYSFQPHGAVGTHAWQLANGGGMQPGYFLEDANFTFPDTTLPNTTGYLTPQPGNFPITIYNISSNSVTSGTRPAYNPWGGIRTNCTAYTTSSTCPTPTPPCLTVATNWVYNSSTKPSPVPAGTKTNTTAHSSGSLPSPIPSGLVTNTYSTRSKSYPWPGTYVPPVTYDGSKWYSYNAISGYSWDTYTYDYPTYSYTYGSSFSYTYNLYTTNSTVVTNHYDNVLYANNNYVSSALNGSTIVLGPNVRLVLPNGLTGAENLYFNYTDNSSPGLTVYAGGTSASISGNQYINPSGFAGSLIVYCAPTVTSFTLNGNGQFTGVLVAPNADLALHGGGNSDQDFSGSLMVNNVRLNGHFKFHWDEALGRMAMNNDARYLVQSWNEIP